MNFQKRKTFTLALLKEKESLSVAELAGKLEVSEITVRRDLSVLAEKGLLVRTHGGAVSLSAASDNIEFVNKVAVRQAEKEQIAKIAAEKIDDGDTVFLDCGSTVFCIAPLLKHKRIKVITNSIPLMYALLNSNVSINLIGGEVDQERMAVHGTAAAQHISRYKASKAFIGADGVSLRGLSSNSEKEAEISMAMAAQSRKVFLLCDSSKLGNDKYLSFAPLSTIDYLITDKGATDEVLTAYRKEGIVVMN
jgi:DeoR family fructose operon transcriptional repressor